MYFLASAGNNSYIKAKIISIRKKGSNTFMTSETLHANENGNYVLAYMLSTH